MAYDNLPHFHRRYGFPVTPPAITVDVPLDMIAHAKHETQNDRYGSIRPPTVFRATPENIFEIAYDPQTKQVKKVAARDSYDDEHDITVVITYDGKIVTVWLNKKTDTHSTLQKSRYEDPTRYQ